MNRFRRQTNIKESLSNRSIEDDNPFDQLKICKDKLKDISDSLRNLSNNL